jgi:hypothetical protein
MPLYYYPGLFIIGAVIFLLIRIFFSAKSVNSVKLYVEALKNENSGRLEDALILYENAFTAAKRTWRNTLFINKITEKLRLLHTVIEYNQNFISEKTNKC